MFSVRALVSCAVICLLAPPPSLGDSAAQGEHYALLVGVREYSEAKVLRTLAYSENDVTDLAKTLFERGGYQRENVVLMTQTAGAKELRLMPYKANILGELRSLLRGRKETDAVLVALSGHGVHLKGDGESYFCPIDARLDRKGTLIGLNQLYKELEKCNAGVKVLFVDACRNDPFEKEARGGPGAEEVQSVTRPPLPPPPKGVVAIFACSEGEEAFEDNELRHGVFFHFIIEGLDGRAAGDDGEVTLDRLSGLVARNVEQFVKRKHGRQQKPDLLAHGSAILPLLNPDPGLRAFWRGRLLLEQGQIDQAVNKLTECVRLKRDYVQTYVERARAYYQGGKGEWAIRDCDAAIARVPSCAEAYLVRAACQLGADREKAENDAKEAMRFLTDPEDAHAYMLRGWAHLLLAWNSGQGAKASLPESEKAVADLDQAIRLDPKLARAYRYRGLVYFRTGKYDSAIADYSEAIGINPKDGAAYRCRGNIYREQKEDYDKAIADYSTAIAIYSKDATAYGCRGKAYLAKKDYRPAIDDLSTAIDELGSKEWELYWDRGQAYLKTGNKEKSKEDYVEALRLNPGLHRMLAEFLDVDRHSQEEREFYHDLLQQWKKMNPGGARVTD
jgi:tetratricopeptide (TPR) repeat protein